MQTARFASVSKITATLLATLDKQPGTPRLLQQLLSNRLRGFNVIPLEGDELPESLQSIASKFGKIPTIGDYDGPVACLVRGDRTLKEGGPKAGPCYKGWECLKDVQFQNDRPTRDSIVFYKSRFVRDSTYKTSDEQMTLLADIRRELELPEDFLSCFGDAALITQLIQGHYGFTDERTPLNGLWVRTDTLDVDGHRLRLGNFNSHGLHYELWQDVGRYGCLGCLPVGVVELEK